jgi:protein-tyrosine phosphatase
MGNICRSPTAEGVFRAMAARAGIIGRIQVDSAGTHDYYSGGPPDWRAMQAAQRRGYDLTAIAGAAGASRGFRALRPHLRDGLAKSGPAGSIAAARSSWQLSLFLDVVPELGVREVPDPYDGGPDGFERCSI